MNKWIIIIVVLILAGLAVGFFITKNSTNSTLNPPANLNDESSESQTLAPSNKNQADSPGVNDTTSTQAPVIQKKVEPQKPAPSTIPKPPDLP